MYWMKDGQYPLPMSITNSWSAFVLAIIPSKVWHQFQLKVLIVNKHITIVVCGWECICSSSTAELAFRTAVSSRASNFVCISSGNFAITRGIALTVVGHRQKNTSAAVLTSCSTWVAASLRRHQRNWLRSQYQDITPEIQQRAFRRGFFFNCPHTERRTRSLLVGWLLGSLQPASKTNLQQVNNTFVLNIISFLIVLLREPKSHRFNGPLQYLSLDINIIISILCLTNNNYII